MASGHELRQFSINFLAKVLLSFNSKLHNGVERHGILPDDENCFRAKMQ
jgi:hypothetical protein